MAHLLNNANIHWSDEEISDFEQKFVSKLPEQELYETSWFDDNPRGNDVGHIYFGVDNKRSGEYKVKSAIGFTRYRGNGDIIINAGYLQLGDSYQNNDQSHYGSSMARFIWEFAQEIRAERVTVFANMTIGSYAWARKYARPDKPKYVASLLFKRCLALRDMGYWTEIDVYAALQILEAQSPDFLAEIAGMRRPLSSFESDLPENRLGFQILSAYPLGEVAWEGYWNLTDAEHVKLIERALSKI